MTRFFRYCEICSDVFHPETRCQKLCPKCRKAVRNVNFIKMINLRTGIETDNQKKQGGKINVR